jgi:hypothetical protein
LEHLLVRRSRGFRSEGGNAPKGAFLEHVGKDPEKGPFRNKIL